MKEKDQNSHTLLLAVLMILVTASMRVPIGCVGPLIGAVREDLNLASGIAGFMTTIPMLIFAFSAPIASRLTKVVDNRILLAGSVGICGVGVFLRSGGSVSLLFLGTGLIGLSIGILNVYMPAMIRQHFAKVGLMMGTYSAVMTASSAISAASCRGLSSRLGGWQGGMVVYVVVPIAALVLCCICKNEIAPHLPEPEGMGKKVGVWTVKNVAIAVFLGLQSLLFFSLLTWYPSVIEAMLPGSFDPGMIVLLMQLVSMIAAFFAPNLAEHVRSRGLLCFLATGLLAIGFVVLALAGAFPAGLLGATVLIGLGCGATMSLAMNLIAMKGDNAAQVARNSAFIQFFSYMLGSLGPTGLGFLYDKVGRWSMTIWVMFGVSMTMAFIGLYAGRRDKAAGVLSAGSVFTQHGP